MGEVGGGLTVSAFGAVAVTPSDSVALSRTTRGIYIGGAGNLAVILGDGTSVTFNGVLAGLVYPFQVIQVKSTNTTATNIVALY